MEFKTLKNIESSFRHLRLFSMLFLGACTLISVAAVWTSYRFAEAQRQKIYVLDQGKSLILALSQDMAQNRPVEAREHVRRFHELFFTLSPGRKRHRLLPEPRREGIFQPHHRLERIAECRRGQYPLRFRLLSLCYRDLRTAEDRP